jgi:hypothetical protein
MDNEIESYFEKPAKKMYSYSYWTTWDTLSEVDRLMESHHGWNSVNWQALPGTKERSSHHLSKRASRA